MLERIGVLHLQKEVLATGPWKEAVIQPSVLIKLDLARIKSRRRMANLGYLRNK
ncbi:MAG: hypothetical protein AAB532_03035 [Patescibacteria group bacterium]